MSQQERYIPENKQLKPKQVEHAETTKMVEAALRNHLAKLDEEVRNAKPEDFTQKSQEHRHFLRKIEIMLEQPKVSRLAAQIARHLPDISSFELYTAILEMSQDDSVDSLKNKIKITERALPAPTSTLPESVESEDTVDTKAAIADKNTESIAASKSKTQQIPVDVVQAANEPEPEIQIDATSLQLASIDESLEQLAQVGLVAVDSTQLAKNEAELIAANRAEKLTAKKENKTRNPFKIAGEYISSQIKKAFTYFNVLKGRKNALEIMKQSGSMVLEMDATTKAIQASQDKQKLLEESVRSNQVAALAHGIHTGAFEKNEKETVEALDTQRKQAILDELKDLTKEMFNQPQLIGSSQINQRWQEKLRSILGDNAVLYRTNMISVAQLIARKCVLLNSQGKANFDAIWDEEITRVLAKNSDILYANLDSGTHTSVLPQSMRAALDKQEGLTKRISNGKVRALLTDMGPTFIGLAVGTASTFAAVGTRLLTMPFAVVGGSTIGAAVGGAVREAQQQNFNKRYTESTSTRNFQPENKEAERIKNFTLEGSDKVINISEELNKIQEEINNPLQPGNPGTLLALYAEIKARVLAQKSLKKDLFISDSGDLHTRRSEVETSLLIIKQALNDQYGIINPDENQKSTIQAIVVEIEEYSKNLDKQWKRYLAKKVLSASGKSAAAAFVGSSVLSAVATGIHNSFGTSPHSPADLSSAAKHVFDTHAGSASNHIAEQTPTHTSQTVTHTFDTAKGLEKYIAEHYSTDHALYNPNRIFHHDGKLPLGEHSGNELRLHIDSKGIRIGDLTKSSHLDPYYSQIQEFISKDANGITQYKNLELLINLDGDAKDSVIRLAMNSDGSIAWDQMPESLRKLVQEGHYKTMEWAIKSNDGFDHVIATAEGKGFSPTSITESITTPDVTPTPDVPPNQSTPTVPLEDSVQPDKKIEIIGVPVYTEVTSNTPQFTAKKINPERSVQDFTSRTEIAAINSPNDSQPGEVAEKEQSQAQKTTESGQETPQADTQSIKEKDNAKKTIAEEKASESQPSTAEAKPEEKQEEKKTEEEKKEENSENTAPIVNKEERAEEKKNERVEESEFSDKLRAEFAYTNNFISEIAKKLDFELAPFEQTVQIQFRKIAHGEIKNIEQLKPLKLESLEKISTFVQSFNTLLLQDSVEQLLKNNNSPEAKIIFRNIFSTLYSTNDIERSKRVNKILKRKELAKPEWDIVKDYLKDLKNGTNSIQKKWIQKLFEGGKSVVQNARTKLENLRTKPASQPEKKEQFEPNMKLAIQLTVSELQAVLGKDEFGVAVFNALTKQAQAIQKDKNIDLSNTRKIADRLFYTALNVLEDEDKKKLVQFLQDGNKKLRELNEVAGKSFKPTGLLKEIMDYASNRIKNLTSKESAELTEFGEKLKKSKTSYYSIPEDGLYQTLNNVESKGALSKDLTIQHVQIVRKISTFYDIFSKSALVSKSDFNEADQDRLAAVLNALTTPVSKEAMQKLIDERLADVKNDPNWQAAINYLQSLQQEKK